jgi:ribosomal protein S18 acetylase RimI-like enzyme
MLIAQRHSLMGRLVMIDIEYRAAQEMDAAAVAAIHAASWRDAYADILDPAFLAGPIEADRLDLWTSRLTKSPSTLMVHVAVDSNQGLVGFICAQRDQDPRWGSLVDNLHVAPRMRGRRIGERLLWIAAEKLAEQNAANGLHLWVFEANEAGLRFYQRLGGRVVEEDKSSIPAANGKPVLRVHWPTLSALTNRR